MKSPWIPVLTAALLFALDRASKVFMFQWLSQHALVWVLPPFFNFTLVLNRGTAFGFFQNSIPVLILISAGVLGLLIYFYLQERKRTLLFSIGMGLLVGGALGNLFDRLFLGYVIDFINFTFWPTFNVADMAINAGIAGLIISYLMQSQKKK